MLKRAIGVIAALLLLGTFAIGSSFAAPISEPVGQPAQAPHFRPQPPAALGALPKVELDLTTVDSAAPPAIALKKSLTADQRHALSAVLSRYKAQLKDIARELPNLTDAAHQATLAQEQQSLMDSASVDARLKQAQADIKAGQASIKKLNAVQAQIDTELASILTPEQLALHKGATSNIVKPLEIADAQIRSAAAAQAKANVAPAANSTYCSYGAAYASLARYYAYYAYVDAYYNYYYYDNDSNAYNAYANLYYAQYNAYYAGQYLGGAYYDLAQLGSDFNNNGYYGLSYDYANEYYSYYGYNYAYNNYYSSGGSGYAYYAYSYGYSSYVYSYNAYVYGSYCV